jgi:hypothetical protein
MILRPSSCGCFCPLGFPYFAGVQVLVPLQLMAVLAESGAPKLKPTAAPPTLAASLSDASASLRP